MTDILLSQQCWFVSMLKIWQTYIKAVVYSINKVKKENSNRMKKNQKSKKYFLEMSVAANLSTCWGS